MITNELIKAKLPDEGLKDLFIDSPGFVGVYPDHNWVWLELKRSRVGWQDGFAIKGNSNTIGRRNSPLTTSAGTGYHACYLLRNPRKHIKSKDTDWGGDEI